jgi:hypothetical protein
MQSFLTRTAMLCVCACTVQYTTIQYRTMQYSTVQCAVYCSAVLFLSFITCQSPQAAIIVLLLRSQLNVEVCRQLKTLRYRHYFTLPRIMTITVDVCKTQQQSPTHNYRLSWVGSKYSTFRMYHLCLCVSSVCTTILCINVRVCLSVFVSSVCTTILCINVYV